MTALPRSLRHRAPLLWLLLPFMTGLVVGRMLSPLPSPLWLLTGAHIAIGVAIIFSKRPLAWGLGLCLGLILAGGAYYGLRRARLPVWDSLPPREARLTLRVERSLAPSPDGKRISGFARVVQADAYVQELVGQRLYFSLARRAGEEPPIRSSEIVAVGVLEALPRSAPVDTFDGYLTNLGLNFRLNRGRIIETTRPPSAYRVFCERTVKKMNALLGEGVSTKRPALTAILRAMMLGQKQELSDEQDALFMHSGTMHLFAINGLHIGVVSLSLHMLLLMLRCPRLAATLLTLAVLWLDVDTTGASPSAVRAFLLVASFEAALVLRLPSNGIAALANAALIVLVLDPMALFSAGFQMSYGVVLAIMCLGLPLAGRLQTRWQPYASLPKVSWNVWQHALTRSLNWLGGALGIGWAATLVSALTGVQFFHILVPGALAANLILVPLASLVIIAGFISIAGGLAGVVAISSWFNHAGLLVLSGIDTLIRFSSRLPGAWYAANWRVPWVGPVAFVSLLVVCVIGYAFRWHPKRGGFWPPVIITALALVFGVKFG
jgi:competence protein ComEC